MKRLFFLLCGLSLLGHVAAFAAVENIKVSGDITTYGVVRSDFALGSHAACVLLGKTQAAEDNVSVLASVSNLRFEADLTEDIMATITMTDERVWGLAADDIYASEAYVTIKNFLNSALTIKIGKQPVHLYEDVVLGDFDGPTNFLATTNSAFDKGSIYDLSPRKNPEGIVAEYDFSEFAPVKLTGGYLKISEGGNNLINSSLNDDTNVYYADLAYMYQDIPVASLFYIGKHTQHKAVINAVPNGKDNVDNYGARFVASPIKDLILLVGGIYQHQNQTNMFPGDERESAFGALLCAQYTFSSVAWKPMLEFTFSFAGDKWDIMYENASNGSIMNAIVADADGLVAGATLSFRPLTDLGIKIHYANARLYKANTLIYSNFANYAITSRKEIGNEVDVSAVYDYTEDVQLGIEGGVFMPGKAFDKSNRETAKQAIGTLKVNF